MAASPTRFLAFDLFIDPHGQPLAAYQIEVTSDAGPVTTLVGIEGGDGAYSQAPYYDPEALHPQADEDAQGDDAQHPGTPRRSDRVILAGLAAAEADTAGAIAGHAAPNAPMAETRIARLHYMLEGEGEASLNARLIVAGADENTPIDADIRVVPVPVSGS